MLVATIREYPWSAPKVWAVVWDRYSQDGMRTKSVTAKIRTDLESAEIQASSDQLTHWPNHAPRVVEVVHGSENRLFIDATTAIDCTVGDLFRGHAWHAETLTAVHDACERFYSAAMCRTNMTESAAP